MKNHFRKTVIINRAVPGSGKTTISRSINTVLNTAGLNIGLHSTDDYFMVDGQYMFDLRRLAEFHQKNRESFSRDLNAGKDIVICDNTNLMPWQTESYTRQARQNGYYIIFLNFTPRALKQHVQAQMVTPEKPDAHGVPESVLRQFIDDFNTYDDLLDRSAGINPHRHFNYAWDERNCVQVRLPGTPKHFDSDAVITIKPEDYHNMKNTVGSQLLQVIAQ